MNDFLDDILFDESGSQGPESNGISPADPFPGQEDPLDFTQDALDADREIETERAGKLIQLFSDKTPEQTTRVNQLADESGLPPHLIEQDIPAIEKAMELKRSEAALQKAPVLRRRMQEPEFVQAIRDEVEGLSWWESKWKDIQVGFEAGDTTRDLGFLGEKHLVRKATDTDLTKIKELREKLNRLNRGGAVLEEAAKAVGSFAGGIPEVLGAAGVGAITGATFAGIAGQVGPQVAFPEEIISVPAFALTGATGTALFELDRQSTKIEGGLAFLDLLDAGIDPENARQIAHGVGMINGLLEITGAGIVTKPLRNVMRRVISEKVKKNLVSATRSSAVTNFLKNYSIGIAGETSTEFAQEVTNIMGEEIARAIDPKEMESLLATEEGRSQLADRLLSIAESTIKAMSVLAIPGAGVQFTSDFNRARKADANIELMISLGEQSADSKVRERSPELFQEYIDEATKDGPVQDVYLGAQEFQEYFQSKGMDPAQVMEELPRTRDQYEDALARGGDLKIPLSEYAAKIAGTEHHAELLRHSRLDPAQDMTIAEAEIWRAEEKNKFAFEAEQALKENLQNEEFQSSSNRVFESVRDQLVGTNRFPNEVANEYAELHKNFAVTMAGKLNLKPHEVFERMGLKIQGEPVVAGQALEQAELINNEAFRDGITETPEFQEFFEGSQVVDDQGKPLVVFHGTNKEFESFEKTPGEGAAGFHFGSVEQAQTAQSIAQVPTEQLESSGVLNVLEEVGLTRNELSKPGGRMIPVFLSVKNPARLHDTGFIAGKPFVDFLDEETRARIPQEFIQALEEKGLENSSDLIVEALEAAGFDGIVYDNLVEGAGNSFVAFKPTQIKSVFNRGTFDQENPNILFQDGAGFGQNWYYSSLAEKVIELPPNKAKPKPGTQWKALISGLPGIKKDEIQWSGLNEWLALQEGNVEIADIRKYLRHGGVNVEETISEGVEKFDPNEFQDSIREEQARIVENNVDQEATYLANERLDDEISEREAGRLIEVEQLAKEMVDESEAQVEALDKNGVEVEALSFDEAMEQAQEEIEAIDADQVLIELEDSLHPEAFDRLINDEYFYTQAVERIREDHQGEGEGKYEKYTLEDGEDYKELLLTLPFNQQLEDQLFKATQKFRLHNSLIVQKEINENPEVSNIQFNAMLDKRNKDLNVDSVPDDVLSQGEKEIIIKGKQPFYRSSHYDTTNILAHVRFKTREGLPKVIEGEDSNTFGPREKVLFIEEVQSDWAQAFRKQNPETDRPVSSGPFVRKTEDWVTLALKRMIAYAADEGFDRIEWTTGLQQSARYSLADQIAGVQWDSKKKILFVKRAGGLSFEPFAQNVTEDKLPDFIGIHAAKNLVGNKATWRDTDALNSGLPATVHSLDSEGLEVGQKGLSDFYDRLVPNMAAKLVKKLTGEKIRTLSGDPREVGTPESDQYKPGAQPGFDISEKMRDQVGQKGLPLFQGGRGSIQFGDQESIISLFNNADLSTFLHESGHFFFENYRALASQPGAPIGILKDMDQLLNFLGVEDLDAWNSMTFEQRRDGHEKVARAFEVYLFEGRAPTLQMRELFRRFRSWMIQVYKSISGRDLQLTDEVRGVFDRMLADEEQIAAAKKDQAYQNVFESIEESGMSQKEWEEYQSLADEDDQAAQESLDNQSLRNMQWLSNARSKELKRLQKRATKQRAGVQEEVATQILQKPVYKAVRFLSVGEGAAEFNVSPQKLSIPALAQMYGDAQDVAWKKLPAGKNGLVHKDGIHPEQVAQMFGFTSGDELIKNILSSKPLKEAIEEATDNRVHELFGNLQDPAQLELAVNKALRNEARTRIVHTELRALSKKTGKGNVLASAAKDWAKQKISLMSFRDLNPNQYVASERRAARLAFEALRRGNTELAVEQKRAQILNHHFAKEAVKAKESVDIAVRFFRKFQRVGIRKKLGIDYLDQIDSLLEKYDLKSGVTLDELDRRRRLSAWISDQEKQGLDPIIHDRYKEILRQRNWREVPVEELMGLKDAIKNIEHLGRLKHKLLTARDQKNLEAAAFKAGATISKNSKKPRKFDIETQLPKQIRARDASGYFASHRKMASILRQMDGHEDGGPLWELFMRPLNERSNWEAEQRENATVRLARIFEMYSTIELGGMYTKTWIAPVNQSLSKMARLMVAMNWGNVVNRQRVMAGFGWTEDQVQVILDTLDERDFAFVQMIHDFVNEYWPQIKDKQTRVTGVAEEKVEADPYQTKFGEQPGGYFRLKYNPELSPKAYADVAKEAADLAMRGNYSKASTRRGHTKARVDEVTEPVRLDFGVIFEHVEEVIHDLAFHEWLIDANRLLGHDAVKHSVLKNYGPVIYHQLKQVVTDVAAGEVASQTPFERGMNWIRAGSSIAAMGWNFGTAFLQWMGLTVSMVRIGPKWVFKGLGRWLRDSAQQEGTVQWIHERSSFMRLRGKTFNREINEIRNKVQRAGAIRSVLGPVEDSYFWIIAKGQMIADIPTWLGQYEKSMAEGLSEQDAYDQADQAVLDSQGGGAIKDLAEIQRGNPMLRLWTNFYSYFNVVYQNSAESFSKTDFKDPYAIGRLAADHFLLITLPVLLQHFLREALLKGECDHGMDFECNLNKIGEDHVSSVFGMLVGPRELGSGLYYGYEGPGGARAFAELGKLGRQALQGEADEAFFKALNESAGILLHYPAGQAEKTFLGMLAIARGETRNPTALAFGEPKNQTR